MKKFLVVLVDSDKRIILEKEVGGHDEFHAKYEAKVAFAKECKYRPTLKDFNDYTIEICEV